MKQTNNAIKFLMAQYRAIFKNAYFKGLTSAVLLTAGLAVAGSAQAALDNLGVLATSDIEINGEADNSGEGTYQNISFGVSEATKTFTNWNNTLTISSGNAGITVGQNYIDLGDNVEAKISGTGGLVIDGSAHNNKAIGLAIGAQNASNNITLDLGNITVKYGTLSATDKQSSISGSVTIAADEISVGGEGISETLGATAIVNLTATNNGGTATTLTLGRDDDEPNSRAASKITVAGGGVVLMSSDNAKGTTEIVGQSLNVNENGLIVTTGAGSNTIASRMTQVDGGLVVSGATSVKSHETVVNGNLLVSGGTLTVNAEADFFDKAKTSFKEAGTFTIGAGADVQIHDSIQVTGGTLVVTDGASLVATASGSSSGSIVVNASDTTLTNVNDLSGKNSATIQISSSELKDFLTAATENDYTELDFDPAKNTLTPTADEFDSKSVAGALQLTSGGHLHLSDTDFVDLTTTFNFSSGTTPVTGTITLGTNNIGIISADKLAVSDVLRTDATKANTAVSSALMVHLDANEMSLGNEEYSGSTLGFRQAHVHDNLNVSGLNGTFKNADEIHLNRDFYQQVPVDVNTTLATVNGFEENGAGSITGADITLVENAASNLGASGGKLSFDGGRWNTAVDITVTKGTLSVGSQAATEDGSHITPQYTNNGNPTYVTLTGQLALNGDTSSDNAKVTVTGQKGADATLDLQNADLVFSKSGSITVSGNTSVYPNHFTDKAAQEFYANNATRGQIGWGKLLLSDRDFHEFLTHGAANNTKFEIGNGGYVYVNGTLTGKYGFGQFVSGVGQTGNKIAFNNGGVLDINGPLNLENPATASDSKLSIGNGTIAADTIILNNLKMTGSGDNKRVETVTVETGTLEVRQGLETNTSNLTFGGGTSGANLVLVGELSDLGELTSGEVRTGDNGVLTLAGSGSIAVKGGAWSTTADINVTGDAGADYSFKLSADEHVVQLAENLSTDENTVYAATFTGDNFAADQANAMFVGDGTKASFKTMQLENNATATVKGKVVVKGLATADLQDKNNPAYDARNTAGIDLGESTITITGAGASFEFDTVAAEALIKANQSGSGWTTDRVNETANKSTFAISNAIADTNFEISDFGELKFNLSNTYVFDKYDARFLANNLLEGSDGSYNNNSFNGYLNLGNAELNIPFTNSPVAGAEQVDWAEVEDFANFTYGTVTTERMKKAIITNIDSTNDYVKGHYGSLQVDVDPSKTTLSLGGAVSLHNAVGGYFVFTGTPSADGIGMTAVGVALGNHSLELENGGKIGAITGNSVSGNDVYFHGTGTTEVIGSISNIDELYVENATIVNGALEADYLESTATLDVVGTQGVEGNITINGGDIYGTSVITANDMIVGDSSTTSYGSLDIAGTVDLTGDLTIHNGHDIELFNGKLSAFNVTLAGANANLIVGYEPNEGEKDDPTTDLFNESLSYGGLLEVTGTTTLNGGMLAVDPDYAQSAAMASLNNLSHTSTAQVSDLLAGSLDGKLFVGQNTALGIGSDSLATLQAKVAKFQNANGAFNPEEIGSVVYLGKSFDVDSTKAGLILTSQSIEQFMDTFNAGNASGATGVFADFNTTADFETQLRNNLVYLGNNTAVLVDAAVMSAADTSLGDQTEAVISFTGTGSGQGTVIADGGDILIDGDVRASTYQVFSNASISYLDGTDYAVVEDSKAAHYDDNINVSTENDFLQGVVDANGQVTLGVNPNGRAIMHGASNPVYESLVAYARGYNGPEYKPAADQAPSNPSGTPAVDTKATTDVPSTTPVTDNGIQGVEDSRELYSYDKQGEKVYGQYSNYFLQETISTGDGSATEAVARLAVYGGAAQAAISAGASTYDAVSGRMGVGANGANITVADNTQGAALWLAPIYKSSDSDGFDAEGVDYGVDMDLYGVALGADYTLSNGIRFGAMFNVGSGEVDGQGAGSAVSNDFDYYGFAVYGGYSMGALSVVADVSYTVADNDLEGNTSIDKVGASLDSTNLSVGVTGQYQLDFNGTTVTPHAGLRFSRIDLDDYTVDGEDIIADYDADSMNIFSIPVGVTFAKEFTGDAWTVKPSLDLTLTGNFGDDETDGTVHWAGVENLSTNVSSEVLDNFTYGATLGVAAKTGNFSLGLGVNYTGSSNVDEFGVQANARFVF